jgi:hypothetical protein
MTMDMSRYPPGWKKMSLAIRRIAGWKCEWCDIPNGAPLPSGRKGKVFLICYACYADCHLRIDQLYDVALSLAHENETMCSMRYPLSSQVC